MLSLVSWRRVVRVDQGAAVDQGHAPPPGYRVAHLGWDVGVDFEPAHARVGDGQPEPESIVGLVACDGGPGPGGHARLVEHTPQRFYMHGLVAVPVERDQFVGGDRAGKFALALADEVHEAAQVE